MFLYLTLLSLPIAFIYSYIYRDAKYFISKNGKVMGVEKNYDSVKIHNANYNIVENAGIYNLILSTEKNIDYIIWESDKQEEAKEVANIIKSESDINKNIIEHS